jgi:hypothetical protein
MIIGAGSKLRLVPRGSSGSGPAFGALGIAAAAMSSGTWSNWSSSTNVQTISDTSGPEGTSAIGWLEGSSDTRTLTNFPGKAFWDEASGRIVIAGSSNGYSSEVPAGTHVKSLRLDVTTGLFSSQWNPVSQNVSHLYDGNPTSPTFDGMLVRRDWSNGFMWQMTRANVWSRVGESPEIGTILAGGLDAPGLDFHPLLGSQGSILVVAGNAGRLLRIDWATKVMTQLAASHSGVAGSHPVISYHPGISSVVFGGGESGNTLYKITSAGVISQVSNTLPPGVLGIGPQSNVVFVPDPQGRAFAWLFDFQSTQKVWRLNLTTGTWLDSGAFPASIGPSSVACVTNLGIHVVLTGAGRIASTSQATVRLFKPA